MQEPCETEGGVPYKGAECASTSSCSKPKVVPGLANQPYPCVLLLLCNHKGYPRNCTIAVTWKGKGLALKTNTTTTKNESNGRVTFSQAMPQKLHIKTKMVGIHHPSNQLASFAHPCSSLRASFSAPYCLAQRCTGAQNGSQSTWPSSPPCL